MTGLVALVDLDHEFLVELLQLPEGAEITSIWPHPLLRGVVRMRIDGMGWSVKTGEVIPFASPNVTQAVIGGVQLKPAIEWKFS